MKKKQILKEQKKLKQDRNQVYMDLSKKEDASKILYIALGVIAFLGIAFVLVNIINGTWNIFNKKNDYVSEIDSTLVMCGTMFDKEDEEYYVLAYHIDSTDEQIYSAIMDKYSDKKIYRLDLSSGFNKSCVSSDKSVISSDLSKLKLTGPTLLRIKDKKIINSYTNKNDIVEYFEKLK